MRYIPLTVMATMAVGLLLAACTQEKGELYPHDIPENLRQGLHAQGFDGNSLKMREVLVNPGEYALRYVLEGDIVMDSTQLMALLDSASEIPTCEHYRTNNVVTGTPRTIRVLGYTGGAYRLTGNMEKGLQRAINNFNALGLELSFSLSWGTDIQGYDIVVSVDPQLGSLGLSGFPIGGNPFNRVWLNASMATSSADRNEHLITHELGHCVGLRHTDYNSPSCSGNEISSVGAVHITGTPTGPNASSIMYSCIPSSTNGEFNSKDIIALQYLY